MYPRFAGRCEGIFSKRMPSYTQRTGIILRVLYYWTSTKYRSNHRHAKTGYQGSDRVTLVAHRLTWQRDEVYYLLLTLALIVFAVAPLAYPGYVQVHSGFVPVYNLANLAGGRLHLGWTPTVATHFDPLRADGLLPYYLALPVVWLGGTPLGGVKAVFALGFLLGAAGVYLWLRPSLGPAGAALAALVYTYLPYHIAAVYVRGAWGEALFLGLLPWALMAATSGLRDGLKSQISERLRLYILTALIWALLGLSQAGLAVWGFLVLLVWMLAGHLRKGEALPRPYRLILAALSGTVVALALTFLAAGFSLPTSPIDFFDHFLYPGQLFSAYWGFGDSRPGWNDGLALGFGFAAVGLGMLTLFLAYGQAGSNPNGSSQDKNLFSPLTISILALALTLLSFGLSAFFWRLTGLQDTLTYPWQLLGLTGLLLSVLAGISVKLDRRLAAWPTYAGLVILTLLASYTDLEPRFTQELPGSGPLAAWDANHLMLLDYRLSVEIPPVAAGLHEPTPGRLPLADYSPLRPGDTLHITLTWQATHPFHRDLKLFLHLLDTSGQVIAQADPLAGAGASGEGADYFTSRWDPGELILDDVVIAIPPDAPPGPYRLALGLYDGDTLERLPVVGRDDGTVMLELDALTNSTERRQ